MEKRIIPIISNSDRILGVISYPVFFIGITPTTICAFFFSGKPLLYFFLVNFLCLFFVDGIFNKIEDNFINVFFGNRKIPNIVKGNIMNTVPIIDVDDCIEDVLLNTAIMEEEDQK